eukprot:6115827-Pleurochrysis_carterae.AAC.1
MQVRCSLEKPTLVDAARLLRLRIIELHSSEKYKAAARAFVPKAGTKVADVGAVEAQFTNAFHRLEQGMGSRQRLEAARGNRERASAESMRAAAEVARAAAEVARAAAE